MDGSKLLVVVLVGFLTLGIVSVKANPAGTDWDRGCTLRTKFIKVGTPYAEEKIYGIYTDIARTEDVKVTWTDSVDKIEDDKILLNQKWLDDVYSNENSLGGSYKAICAMVDLLGQPLDKGVFSVEIAKIDAINDMSSFEGDDNLHRRILKMLFELTWTHEDRNNISNIDWFNGNDGVVDRVNEVRDKVFKKFEKIKECFDGYFKVRLFLFKYSRNLAWELRVWKCNRGDDPLKFSDDERGKVFKFLRACHALMNFEHHSSDDHSQCPNCGKSRETHVKWMEMSDENRRNAITEIRNKFALKNLLDVKYGDIKATTDDLNNLIDQRDFSNLANAQKIKDLYGLVKEVVDKISEAADELQEAVNKLKPANNLQKECSPCEIVNLEKFIGQDGLCEAFQAAAGKIDIMLPETDDFWAHHKFCGNRGPDGNKNGQGGNRGPGGQGSTWSGRSSSPTPSSSPRPSYSSSSSSSSKSSSSSSGSGRSRSRSSGRGRRGSTRGRGRKAVRRYKRK